MTNCEHTRLTKENAMLKMQNKILNQKLNDAFDDHNRPKLTVCVKGRSGTGKSTVARLIEEALIKEGINIDRKDYFDSLYHIPDEKDGVIESTVQERKESLVNKGLFVLIETETVV